MRLCGSLKGKPCTCIESERSEPGLEQINAESDQQPLTKFLSLELIYAKAQHAEVRHGLE